jgi:hypothetical protein
MNNLISGNVASGPVNGAGVPAAMGGGIDAEGDSPMIVQNIIVNNTADLGGGISVGATAGDIGPFLVNNTIAGNLTTQNVGSAVYATGYNGPVELFNNLLIGAQGQNAVYCDESFSPVPPVFENDDVFSPAGAGFVGGCTTYDGQYGNISADPLFVNPSSNDYQLTAESPAIDAGQNGAPDIPATDYYGNPRIVAGKVGDRAIIDIGAAEFQPASPISTPAPTPTPTPIGNIINVPEDEPGIQAAINTSANGDVIQVAPGTYFEAINFEGKAIQVVSTGGAQVTVINGHGLGPTVTFAAGETASSVLSGFTIMGGVGQAGGILIENSSPTVSDNVITGNYGGYGGAGIGISNGSPLITGNAITNNVEFEAGGGGGISITGTGTAQIISNTITDNFRSSGDGGGISVFAAGSPLIMNNYISGNLATGLFGCSQGLP